MSPGTLPIVHWPVVRRIAPSILIPAIVVSALWAMVDSAQQQMPEFRLEIRDHLFYPSELIMPANQKIKLTIHNQDATPEEFESYDLNRKKMIPGRSEGIIYIGPLSPGVHTFFGGFNPKTAQGTVYVE